MSRDVDEPEDESPGRPARRSDGLRVTSRETITVAALSGAAIGYLLLTAVEAAGWVPPTPPWTLIAAMLASAAVALVAARRIRRRIRATPIEPAHGVRAVVLGKSMLVTGAVVAGGHVAYALASVSRLEAPGPRERFVLSCVTVAASALFAFGGSRLERACVVEDPPEES